jgi:hypothetical protein
MHRLRTTHLVVGLLGLAVFLLTGQYMHWFQGHLQGMADGPRLMHRSVHIYVLWSSLLNVVLGCYLTPLRHALWRVVQWMAGCAVLTGPLLLTVSFFIESHDPLLVRPIARMAIYLALAGGVLHALSSLCSRRDD